ncbi:hypothetical protein [Amycolatopsis sp. cmx-11-12]|uniref:hypothetical protein n=1 Tax=Amycolatopsis sp. cmx-11-12 TaxID=2785795 RepID=UPI003917D3AF
MAERGIRIALSSLSDWQHGRTRPGRASSLRAVEVLEEILEIPRGALLKHLDVAAGRVLPASRQGIDDRTGPVGELLGRLSGSRDWNLELLSEEHSVTVDAQRRPSRNRSTCLVRARRDQVDRHVVAYFGDAGCDIEQVDVQAVRNCRVGRVHRHPEGRVLVVEWLFDQALRAGETWLYAREFIDRTMPAGTEVAHAFRHAQANHVLEVRFQPSMLPADCYAYVRADLNEDYHRLTDLTLNSHHAVHVVAHGRDSGVLGIAWTWPGSA